MLNYSDSDLKQTADPARIRVYRQLTFTFFAWCLVEGAIRKWVFPQATVVLFLVKYGIWGIANLYLILSGERISRKQYPYFGLILFFLLYGLLEIGVTASGFNPIIGLLGFMIHFWFISLALILPLLIRSETQIKRILDWFPLILIPITLIGIVQYFSPADSLINRYSNDEDENTVAGIGEYVRITGIFSYISTYTAFLHFVLLFLFARLLHIRKINLKSLLLITAFGLGVLNIFMTGSRGLSAYLSLELAGTVALLTFTSSSLRGFARLGSKVILAGFLLWVLIAQTPLGQTVLGAFTERVKADDSIGNRVDDTLNHLKFLDEAGWLGFGIGTTYQGAIAFRTGERMPYNHEEEAERVVLELGLAGYLLSYLIKIAIFLFAWHTYRIQPEGFLRTLSILFMTYMAVCLLWFGYYTFNWLENIMYWTITGGITALRQISLPKKTLHEYTRLEN
jgi:hypothetical protein